MKNICFFEGSCAEVDSALVKNKFIADTDEEQIIICDKKHTDSNEIISFFSENTFLEGYDVVVFGENIPDGTVDYVTVMLAQNMKICAISIKRKLFEKTGCFNEKIKAFTDYEFLVRAARNGSVYFVPVCIGDVEEFDRENEKYNTIAFLLRDNMELLEKDGKFDMVYTCFRKSAKQKGKIKEFNDSLEIYLKDAALYERMAGNTAPFLVISDNDTCYGVLNSFADCLADNLVKNGQAVITTDCRYGNMDDFYNVRYKFYKGVVGFQSPILEDEIFRKTNFKKFQMWYDHPAFFNNMFNNLTDDYYVLCQDMYHADYLRKYAHAKNAVQFPPAGIDAGLINNKNRSYDVVFIGTFFPVSDIEINWLETEIAEFLMKNPNKTLETALEQMIEKYGITFSENEFKMYMCSLYPLFRNIINYFKNVAVEAILKAGIKLNVFGDSWRQYQGACPENLIIHPAVSVEESLQIWGHSKVGLNIMTWHKGGMTERIANIMLSGAVCISDETTYLREHFKEDEEIVLFELGNISTLPDKINMLLKDDALREKISTNAYKKASREHTWSRRAKQLLELCNN